MELKEFGLFFLKAREESGYESQRQLAIASGVSNGTIARIESGTQKVTPETLKKLAPYLKSVGYAELMERAGYIDEIEPEVITEINGEKIVLTQQEFEVLNELKKHSIAFENLKSNPEKKVKQMIKSWKTMQEALKEIDDDDSDYLE